MEKQFQAIYDADLYVRLSKEDGDVDTGSKYESNSISNQKELIQQFLVSHPEIRVHAIRIDDGYTGTNFNRPGFQLVLQDIKEKKINCVIVKDLSRIGRNYLEVGEYIQEVFPCAGVRVIAINDNYDSITEDYMNEDIIIPFKNLINDSYSRDMSIKIRSNLQTLRKSGKYTGAYVPFGYQKSELDHNVIVVDEYAANVVRDIFQWKLDGMNQAAIADKLNEMGIPSPMEYKRMRGINYHCSFKTNDRAIWCAQSVTRILKNDIYIGNLTQGVRSKLSYRSSIIKTNDPSDWIVNVGAIEAIIKRQDFERVQELLLRDTRTAPKGNRVYTYAGLLFCGDCGHSMIRKTIPGSHGKKYVYYVCSANKKNKNVCDSHSISEEQLNEAILITIQKQIQAVADIEQLLLDMPENNYEKMQLAKMDERIQLNEEEIEKCRRLQLALYEDLREGLIDKEEYMYLKEEYRRRKRDAEESNRFLRKEQKQILDAQQDSEMWMQEFVKQLNIETVTRQIAIQLIERIQVYKGGRIKIVFKYQDKFEACCDYIENMRLLMKEGA